MSETKFIDGLNAFKPHEKAPDFVKATVSIDLQKFAEFVRVWKSQNPNEKYLRIDILESKKGSFYAKENDFKPQKQGVQDMKEAITQGGGFDDEIPFAPYANRTIV